MKIEICIHCFDYQHRLCWMLSSILQQQYTQPLCPTLITNISYTNNNGDPSTEDVIKLFRSKGLNIIETIMSEYDMEDRSKSRNIQAKNSTADWLLFADCDMVYSKFFFNSLSKSLSNELKDVDVAMGADRHSLDIEYCCNYFKNDKNKYPCVIDNVDDVVKEWPLKWIRGAGTCAGNFQLANREVVIKKIGKYSNRENDHWRATKSDRRFRIAMGGRMPIKVEPQYHLNHGRELGVQR